MSSDDHALPSTNARIKKSPTKGRRVRLRRKKKQNPSKNTISDIFDLPPIILVLTGIAFLIFLTGFMRSIALLPSADNGANDRVMRLFSIMDKIENLKNPSSSSSSSDRKPVNVKESDAVRRDVEWKVQAPNEKAGSVSQQKVNNNNNNDDVYLPPAKWPVSIRDEDGNFEDIIHPGDHKTVMTVPKFWSPPLTGPDKSFGSLMSRELATRFGSYVDGHVDEDYRKKGRPRDRTIFVSIASYRDWQCRYTVESLFKRAKFPNRVRVVVVDQIDDGDPSCGVPIKDCASDPTQALCMHIDQVDILEVEATLAVGPVFARHLGHRLYRGEYYAMQIDAHVTFVQDWDEDIINQFDATKNEMAVMSFYLTDIEGSIDSKTGKSLRNTIPIMCNTDYEDGQGKHLRHGSQPEGYPAITNMPMMQPYWAAGWSFSRGHFVVNIPYDLYQPMIFMGEESSIGIRGFTYGYDHYTARRSICFHTYANGKNAKERSKVPHFWNNGGLYPGTGVKAMKRLLGIIGMNPEVDPSEWDHTDEKLYGVGTERTVEKFFETFGIDVVHKKVQQHLCMFVRTGNMHRKFLPFLRENGMGIDYSKIDYKFVDPKA